MPRERIVLETTDHRKAALVETIELQGETLAGWFDEQLTVSLAETTRTSVWGLESPKEPGALLDSAQVFQQLVDQDWSFTDDDTGYLTHDLHPYPAKFIPQIPANLITRLSLPGDLVLDPFGGSATTAVEAVRMRRRVLSIDANPLSELIGRVKTGFMNPLVRNQLEQLHAAVASYVLGCDGRASWSRSLLERCSRQIPEIPNVGKWFSTTVVAELALLRHLIHETTDGLAQDAARLALSRIISRVSNQESETRYVATAKVLAVGLTLRAYLEALRSINRRLEAAVPDLAHASARFVTGDSRKDLPR